MQLHLQPKFPNASPGHSFSSQEPARGFRPRHKILYILRRKSKKGQFALRRRGAEGMSETQPEPQGQRSSVQFIGHGPLTEGTRILIDDSFLEPPCEGVAQSHQQVVVQC